MFTFRLKGNQRLPVRNSALLVTPEALYQSWSIDFMHNALVCGRRFQTFNVVDDFNCEALGIEIELKIPEQLVSLTLAQWGGVLEFIKLSNPTKNAFIERYNRIYRKEIHDLYMIRTLNVAREITERWLAECNGERTHEFLNNVTLKEYRLMAGTPQILKSAWYLNKCAYKTY